MHLFNGGHTQCVFDYRACGICVCVWFSGIHIYSYMNVAIHSIHTSLDPCNICHISVQEGVLSACKSSARLIR